MIKLINPNTGEVVIDPILSELRDLVLNGGEKYWCSGSGEAVLTYWHGQGDRELSMCFDADLGYYMKYHPNLGTYIALSDRSWEQTRNVYVGGDPVLIPEAFLVPVASAWRIVEEFCATGEMLVSNACEWKRRRDIDWHFGTE